MYRACSAALTTDAVAVQLKDIWVYTTQHSSWTIYVLICRRTKFCVLHRNRWHLIGYCSLQCRVCKDPTFQSDLSLGVCIWCVLGTGAEIKDPSQTRLAQAALVLPAVHQGPLERQESYVCVWHVEAFLLHLSKWFVDLIHRPRFVSLVIVVLFLSNFKVSHERIAVDLFKCVIWRGTQDENQYFTANAYRSNSTVIH